MAYAIVAAVALSLLSFVAVIIGTAAGVGENDGFSHGLWPLVLILPLYGLPIAFLLIFALLISNAVRRGQATKRSQR